MSVLAIPALSDNYAYLLPDPTGEAAAVIDPAEAASVVERLAREGLRLTAILATHHHRDHVGGIQELLRRFPGVPVIGGARDRGRIPAQTRFVGDGDLVEVAGRTGRVLDTPGHTRGHVSYFFADPGGVGGDLFSGDTLFACTIGNLFEGTPADMLGSMRKIRALPPGVRVWCGHEYTRLYVREAAGLDRGNPRITERLSRLAALPADASTMPLLLDEERATNPYLRWDEPSIRALVGGTDDESTFAALCELD